MRKDKLQQVDLKRAIVIDDDESLRTAIAAILKKRGCEAFQWLHYVLRCESYPPRKFIWVV